MSEKSLMIDFGNLEDTVIDHVFEIMRLRAENARLERELATACRMAEFNRTGWEGSVKILASTTLWLADKRTQAAFWGREAHSLKSEFELSAAIAAAKEFRKLEELMESVDEALAHNEADSPGPDYDGALEGMADD